MSPALLALVVAISGGTWIFTKLQRQTGSANGKSAAIGAAVSGIIIFILVFTLAKMIIH